MKHPLWILNSAIASLLLCTFLFIILSRQHIKKPFVIEPEISAERVKRDEIKINISKIYENDIFDTYQKKPEHLLESAREIPLPPPPRPVATKIPEIPKIEFLDPLNITLKGIIISNNDNKNRAVIQDNDTKREATYKVGNMIADAQLIRIFNNKVIFLRSNGQQEVLYLREKDALLDPTYTALSNWSHITKHIDNYYHIINPVAFIEHIQNVAQFIDALDITTAYQKGKSIGCRVGVVKQDSLGAALGFNTGDIILSIDNIPATDINNRFLIYKNIIAKKPNDTIVVKILRDQQPATLVYTLEEFSILDKLEEISPAQELEAEQNMKEKQLKALEQKQALTPTTNDLKKRERQNMLSRGKMPTNYKTAQMG
jgi:type II secretion system protein C